MKFSLKNIEVEFGGWSLEFARVRMQDFFDFRDSFIDLPEEKYNDVGGIDIEELTRVERTRLFRCSEAFMVKNLLSAKCGDEVAETEREKELLITFLKDDADFRTFCEGYINGEKKT